FPCGTRSARIARVRSFVFAILLMGCGARVEPATTSDTGPSTEGPKSPGPVADTGISGGGGFVDAATPSIDGGSPDDPDDPPPPIDPGAAQFVDLEVCGSAPGVDKIIFDMSEPMATLPDAGIRVSIAGTTCSDAFNSAMAAEYAYGSKCGAIDRSQDIQVIV